MDLELKKISDNVYYIPGSTNTGVITEQTQNQVNFYLIDTPGNAEYAPQVLKLLENFAKNILKQNWTLKSIITTHSHADHVSCCSYLKEKTGCDIWCTQEERGNMELPTYEQAIICGGWPLPELQTPFYQAEKILDITLIKESDILLCDGTKITFIKLPGHHFGMTGVLVKTSGEKTENTVLFAADGIFGREQMKKYWIPFMLDVGSFKMSLDKIVETKADFVLPAHGAILKKEETEALAELNRFAVLTTEKSICKILETPHTAENLLKAVFDENNIPGKLGQYILIGCTVRSYLSYLYRSGKIRYYFQDNLMFWQRVK